jgi:hypothetical protein
MSDIFNHESDAWDSLLFGDEPVNFYPKPITCRRCGERGLSWKKLDEGWRLHKYDKDQIKLVLHVCNPSS